MKTLAAYIAEQNAKEEDFASRNNLHPSRGADWEAMLKTEFGKGVQAAVKAGEPVYDGWEQDYPGLAFRLKKGLL